MKKSLPGKTALILASIAFALTVIAILINYFRGAPIAYSHCLFALGLLAFVVWFSGRSSEHDE